MTDYATILYLARYLFVAVLCLITLILTYKAYRALHLQNKRLLQASLDVFLISQIDEEQIRSLPLFHTSSIGSAKSSDIRLKHAGVCRHHALIYLYGGKWYLRQLNSRAIIYLNNEEITAKTELRHGDVISFGSLDFSFVNREVAAIDSGLDYQDLIDEDEVKFKIRGVRLHFTWFLLTCFYLLAGFLLYQNISPDLVAIKPTVLVLFTAFFVLLQLPYFIWSYLLAGFDRLLYTVFASLASVGLIIQSRFLLLARVYTENPEYSLLDWQSGIKRELMVQILSGSLIILFLPLIFILVQRTKILELIGQVSYVLVPLMYLATKVLGSGASELGAGLWIILPGNISLQLTEFAKLFYLLALGNFFKTRSTFKSQLFFGIWAAFNFALILILPDLGSLMILVPVTLIVFLIMNSAYIKTVLILFFGSIASVIAYHYIAHVQARVDGWLSLWQEVNDYNRQIIYGLQAMARGGLFGLGLGQGSPESIPFAPYDMVFAVLSEEMGLILGLCIVMLFIILWVRGASVMMFVQDGYTLALIIASASYFFIEAAVVIAGTTGIIPLTGATLPFLAKGGSSLIAKWLLASALLGLFARRERRLFHEAA